MFSPFKKKFKAMDEYPDRWGVGQGTLKGKPISVRFRSGLKDAAGHPDYPYQIGVAVPLLRPTEFGLPAPDEIKELDAIENLLEQRITKNKIGIFAASITTNGMREFVFYVKEKKPDFEREIKSINAAPHELQFMIQDDPDWETFKRFAKG